MVGVVWLKKGGGGGGRAPLSPTMIHYAAFWKPNRTRLIAQLWDLIETSSFREDIKGIKYINDNDDDYKDIAEQTTIMAY